MIADTQRRSPAAPIRVAVLLATKGRPQAAAQLLRSLEEQSVPPSIVVVSATAAADIEAPPTTLNVEYIFGPAGLTAQRNRALERVRTRADVAVFFDDDFAPAADWVEQCARLFVSESDVAGANGVLIRDGAKTPPISWEEAQRAVAIQRPTSQCDVSEITDLYGCNMAYRMSAIGDMRFDERLVLYGWLEDKDFSRQAAKKGRLVECSLLVGVHLGLRAGRVSGKQFGYSQIVNPWYLLKKGALSRREVCLHVLKALIVNAAKTFRPEEHIDRRGRLQGNLAGVIHLLSGACRPEGAAEL